MSVGIRSDTLTRIRAHQGRPRDVQLLPDASRRRLPSASPGFLVGQRCLLGLSTPRILLRHLLPNCLSPLIVVAALQVAAAIALEATLSFLGLGMPVTEPSLGLLIANGFQYLYSGRYWMSVFPGVALLLTILALNLVADQVRDVLNPRLRPT